MYLSSYVYKGTAAIENNSRNIASIYGSSADEVNRKIWRQLFFL